MLALWKRYFALLENDLSTQIFDNVKNLLVCVLLFAAGTNTLVSQQDLFIGVFASSVAGWGLIVLSMLLSVSDGIRRLAKLRYHLALQLLLILVYLVVAERVVEIVWGLRAH
ncbi:hypothetical protein [Pseudomonas sp. RA_5y_Pfl1_P24]|uniref:hypothetical protein n=1 Tax=Pseudomonas sp. RA_5y_Pfl1_P24 TaxID=3088706 RepID=UPI0030D77D3A